MTISSYCFSRENIILNLTSKNKNEAIETLVDNLVEAQLKKKKMTDQERQTVKKKLLQAFLEREEKGSTGLQFGISIPHIKTNLVMTTHLAIGIHHHGVDFNSLDQKLTHIIILSMVPFCHELIHLKFLSELSRSLYQENYRNLFLSAKTDLDVFQLVKSKISNIK